MAQIIRMPEVLAGAAEAAIQTWLVEEGAAVRIDQTLAEIETDKAVVEFQSEVEGVIGRLLVAEGENIAVGHPILVLLAEGEPADAVDAALIAEGLTPAASASAGPDPAASEPVTHTSTVVSSPVGATTQPGHDDERARLFASPLVRRIAKQEGIDLASITGTGPNGRIVRRDVERSVSAATAAAPQQVAPASVTTTKDAVPSATAPVPRDAGGAFEDLPLDRMRKAIARRLTESKSTVPHFYLVAECRVDALLELRRQVNENAVRRVSVNDFVVKAVAAALVEVPEANAIWNGDSIRKFSSADISVAVATDGGLKTPVLRGVEKLPLTQVSATVADLAERARAGRLKQHELEGGSFSISNLGMYGTKEFSAILNPPQSGILAVGAARHAPVVEDDTLVVGTLMTVTLSADHRVVDGAVAAQWLSAFQRLVENPLRILV